MLAVGEREPVSLTRLPGDEARSGDGGPSMLTGRERGRCGRSSSPGAMESCAGWRRRLVVGRDSSANGSESVCRCMTRRRVGVGEGGGMWEWELVVGVELPGVAGVPCPGVTLVLCGDVTVLRRLGGVVGHSRPSSLLSVRRRARRASLGLEIESRRRAGVGDAGSSDQVARAATSLTLTEVWTGVGDAVRPSGKEMEAMEPRRERGVVGHTGVGGLDSTGAVGRPMICECRLRMRSGRGGSTKVPTPGTDVMVTLDWARRRERSTGAGSIHDQRLVWVRRSSRSGSRGGGGMRMLGLALGASSSARVGRDAADAEGCRPRVSTRSGGAVEGANAKDVGAALWLLR
jgi:hypothetical protein